MRTDKVRRSKEEVRRKKEEGRRKKEERDTPAIHGVVYLLQSVVKRQAYDSYPPCCSPCRRGRGIAEPRSKSPVATENLLENTDGGGSLLPSIYADARYIDAHVPVLVVSSH